MNYVSVVVPFYPVDYCTNSVLNPVYRLLILSFNSLGPTCLSFSKNFIIFVFESAVRITVEWTSLNLCENNT